MFVAAAVLCSTSAVADDAGRLRIICFGAHPDDCELRAAGVAAKWTAAGIFAAVVGLVALIFLTVGLVRLLEGLVGMQWAYTIIGGLFILIGAFLWRQRIPRDAAQD